MSKARRKGNVFILSGVNAEQIAQKYSKVRYSQGHETMSRRNSSTSSDEQTPPIFFSAAVEEPDNLHQFTDLSLNPSVTETLLDTSKNRVVLWHTMMHYVDTGEPLPEQTSVWCWWCKHPFRSRPFGCPLYYDATYDCFLTEGIFCSLNCLKAYIDNEHGYCENNMKFAESPALFHMMYKKFMREPLDTRTQFRPAGNWKLLKNFGGNETIENFRENFNIVHHENTGNIKFPPMYSGGEYIEEHVFL